MRNSRENDTEYILTLYLKYWEKASLEALSKRKAYTQITLLPGQIRIFKKLSEQAREVERGGIKVYSKKK